MASTSAIHRVSISFVNFSCCGSAVPLSVPLPKRGAAATEQGLPVEKGRAPADAVVLAVAHDCYRASGWPLITRLLANGRGLVMDVKGVLDPLAKPAGIEIWR